MPDQRNESRRTSRNLVHVRPWWRRQWLSMRRDRFTRRQAAISILGDVWRGFQAKYVRRVP